METSISHIFEKHNQITLPLTTNEGVMTMTTIDVTTDERGLNYELND